MRPRLVPLVVLLLAPFAAAGPAAAQPQTPDAARTQPLDRLLPEIRRNHPGQFLDAEGITRNGEPGYRLKWLAPDGRVNQMDVDARTGRVMGSAPDRGMPQRGGFYGRSGGGQQERARSDFQNFDDGRGEDSRPRLGDRGGFPGRDFGQERQQAPGRFNRPDFGGRGDGGFGGRFGARSEDGNARGGFGRRGRAQGQGDE